MAEIRIDPLTGDYIIVNDTRMNRPIVTNQNIVVPECPFCPNSKKRHPGLPLEYEAIAVENLFPSLVLNDEKIFSLSNIEDDETIYHSTKNFGKCEVLLYSSNHELEFYDQSSDLTLKIMKLWQNRFKELSGHQKLKYIFIFENRGEAVGVTIHHPHGQLYALPVIPPAIEKTLRRFNSYNRSHNKCLLCTILEKERKENLRIIEQNDFFIAFVPYFAKMLYEVHIAPITHKSSITEFNDKELESLGNILQQVRKYFDLLFKNKKASFMMMLFNKPINTQKNYFFHFYIQFVCLDRDEKNYKYRASVETGLQFWTNDSSPERIAEEFRRAKIF